MISDMLREFGRSHWNSRKKKRLRSRAKLQPILVVKGLHTFSDEFQNNWAANMRLILELAYLKKNLFNAILCWLQFFEVSLSLLKKSPAKKECLKITIFLWPISVEVQNLLNEKSYRAPNELRRESFQSSPNMIFSLLDIIFEIC